MPSVSVRIDKDIYDLAVQEAKSEYRTTPQQINFWAKIGYNALANPDLPIDCVRDLLIAQKQPSEPFEFEGE